MRLGTIFYDDFEMLDAYGPLEMFGALGDKIELVTIAELQNEALLDFLKRRCPRSQVTMSVCTGSALLAKAGLLDGMAATTNKMFFELARSQGDLVQWQEAARWVDAGQYVTSSGVSAGTDMALAVIQRIFGSELAKQVMNYTEYQWHRDAASDPFAALLNQGVVPE